MILTLCNLTVQPWTTYAKVLQNSQHLMAICIKYFPLCKMQRQVASTSTANIEEGTVALKYYITVLVQPVVGNFAILWLHVSSMANAALQYCTMW